MGCLLPSLSVLPTLSAWGMSTRRLWEPSSPDVQPLKLCREWVLGHFLGSVPANQAHLFPPHFCCQ